MSVTAGPGTVVEQDAEIRPASGIRGSVAYRRRRRQPLASVLLHGTLVAASFVALFPIAWVLLSSFKPGYAVQRSEIRLFEDPTFDNYLYVLTETNFPLWFVNSVAVAAVTMVVGVLLSATTGYAVSRFAFPGRRGLMWTFLVTQMFPVSILIVPIYVIMANLGLIDTLPALMLAYLTTVVPLCAWLLRGYFDTIPRELDEAAALDGLGPFATFWRVVMPLARPGLAVTGFFAFLTAWGEVAYASSFVQTDSRFTLAYGMQQFVPQFNPQWDHLTAAAVLVTIPAGVVFFFAQRHLVAGLTAGGTKG